MSDATSATAKNADQIVQAIFKLDLEVVKQQLRDEEDGEGWSVEEANHHETEYKQFLALAVKYPGEKFSPSKSVDAFWHAHILNTQKYACDCEQTFGYFLHHSPSARTGTANEKAQYEESFNKFQLLKEAEFASLHTASKKAAFCAMESPQASQQAAFCAMESPQASQQAAFCAMESPQASQQAAFCAMESPQASQQAAFCAMESPQASHQAAFCAMESPQASQQAAS